MRTTVLLAAALASGCAGSRHTNDMRLVSDSLSNSPTFARVKQHSPHAAFFIDRSTSDHIVVVIGENLPDRFARWDTLRVTRDGAVRVLVVDSNGEERWQAE